MTKYKIFASFGGREGNRPNTTPLNVDAFKTDGLIKRATIDGNTILIWTNDVRSEIIGAFVLGLSCYPGLMDMECQPEV